MLTCLKNSKLIDKYNKLYNKKLILNDLYNIKRYFSNINVHINNNNNNNTIVQDEIPTASWQKKSLEIEPRTFGKKIINNKNSYDKNHYNSQQKLYEQLNTLNKIRKELIVNISDKHPNGTNKQQMDHTTILKWLDNYEIPSSAFVDCKNEEERWKIRELYARQLRYECSVHDVAYEKFKLGHERVLDIELGSTVKSSRELMNDWYPHMVHAINDEKNKIINKSSGVDRQLYGPYLLLLDSGTLAVISMIETLNHTLTGAYGATFVKLVRKIAKSVQEEVLREPLHVDKSDTLFEMAETFKNDMMKKLYKKNKKNTTNTTNSSNSTITNDSTDNNNINETKNNTNMDPVDTVLSPDKDTIEQRNTMTRRIARLMSNVLKDISDPVLASRVYDAYWNAAEWDTKVSVKLGSILLHIVLSNCKIEAPIPDTLSITERKNIIQSDNKYYENAFEHTISYAKSRKRGIVICNPLVHKRILEMDFFSSSMSKDSIYLPHTARYLPMLVPPKPWKKISDGGYLRLPTKIMRHRDSLWQLQCAKQGNLEYIKESLNVLGQVPWIINKEILNVIQEIWKNGGNFGDLPTREDIIVPRILTEEDKKNMTKKEIYAYNLNRHKMEQKNSELHSLRCNVIYKLQVAKEFQDEKQIFFPYNIDFRGRAYPIPPNLNHLGSDLSRSLLIFRDKKPLGKRGLYWLKVHLANLFGVDKISFDDRVQFIDDHMHHAFESAERPCHNFPNQWWTKADYPFLALGCIFELVRAIKSGDPESYESNIPVHQDGSCNGLQHYAALGRDAIGAEQVNLLYSDKPQDVYTSVADRVFSKIKQDSENIVHESIKLNNIDLYNKLIKRKKYATFLKDKITRKLVKQTVMTSVYGVTFIGARKQIQTRLTELLNDTLNQSNSNSTLSQEMEKMNYYASLYAAEITLDSMGNLFTGARDLMDWLSKCAKIVAEYNQPMSWITPLGLPVVQPYRTQGTMQVKTRVQSVILSLSDNLDVSAGKQKSAFPPNYVHSLDSTHMLMTAVKCHEKKLDFAAVHDSFWTHACSVDDMNYILRQEFVRLYNQPLLQDLHLQLSCRFPNVTFPPVPASGNLDLKKVMESPYFFN